MQRHYSDGLLIEHANLKTGCFHVTIRAGMALDNAFARGIARAVTHEIGARAAIRLAPAGPTRGRYALRWVFEDNPRAALLTPWRWGERFRAKSGAYHWLDDDEEATTA